MKKPFKDPIAYKERKMRGPVSDNIGVFAAPTKEEATTGRYMDAGDIYGVGHRTPVGKEMARPITDGPIPQKAKCFDPAEAIR